MPRYLLMALPALWLIAACSPSPEPRSRPRRESPPAIAPRARVEKLGRQAVSRLRLSLRQRVIAAVRKGGLVAAIDVCAGEAQRITAQINSDLGGLVRVKRTTLRVRNPANAPDAAERRVLEGLASLHKQGKLPDHVLEREARPTGAVYRYYVPIQVGGLCAKCHGPADKLAPAVRTVLGKRYPSDRATGYRPGDLRGMFSVTIPESTVR